MASTKHHHLLNGSACITAKEEQSEKQSKALELDQEDVKTCTQKHVARDHGPHKGGDKNSLAYEEILTELKERIQALLARDDFTTSGARPDLKFVQRQTRYIPDLLLNRRIVEHMVKYGIAHVFLKVWQSVNTVDYISSDNFSAFKNLQTALSIVWNCSDKSSQLCESLSTAGVIQLFLAELEMPKLLKNEFLDENTLYLAKAFLGILHNIVRLCSESRRLFRSSNALKTLKKYLDIDQYLVKTKAYLILSYIISEEENDIINATDDNITFIIQILREALNSENHFSMKYAFWASEIACGLNHLARNDNNKSRIAQLGALSLYNKMLKSTISNEQSLATAGLWILSFHDDNKRLLRQEAGCIQTLKELATHGDDGVRRSARGTLWVIRASSPEKPPSVPDSNLAKLPHVMISYHWASQEIMREVRNRLKAAGFKVWMDIDNMSGSTLEAMALAVEKAAVVLVCLTQAYKDSPSCRTEAEYIYRLRKDLIPLLLQPSYVPDGWLGMLVGSRLYFDLSCEKNLDNEIPRLIQELGTRGRITAPSITNQYQREISQASSLSPRSTTTEISSISSIHSYTSKSSVSAWCCEEVRAWMAANELAYVQDRLRGFSGDLLLQLKKMMQSAPEHFYRTLETKLHFDLITQLKFAKALDQLA